MLNCIWSYLKWIWMCNHGFQLFWEGFVMKSWAIDQGCVFKKQKFHQVQFNRTILATEKTPIKTFCFICDAGSQLTDCIEVWRQHCCFDTVHPTQDVPKHLMELLLSWTNGAVGYRSGKHDEQQRRITWHLKTGVTMLTSLLQLFTVALMKPGHLELRTLQTHGPINLHEMETDAQV